MLIRQIRSVDGTGALSYVIVSEKEHLGVVVDPNIEDLERIEKLVGDLNLRITHIVDTHTHADHISAAAALRQKTGALTVMHSRTAHKGETIGEGERFGIGHILRANAGFPVDHFVQDGDTLTIGSVHLRVLFTPGHTDNHISLLVEENVFTGDLLLIGQAGRSDLPGGNPEEQYDSIFGRILPLGDRTRMYPGHDYSGSEYSSLGDEKRTNPFLQPRTKQEFIRFVRDFFPPLADAIADGEKVTLQCGVQRVVRPGETIQSITAQDLSMLKRDGRTPFMLDVREPVELHVRGAIEGVHNVPIGSLKARKADLPENKETLIVCVCQSGSRSREAVHHLQREGYTNVMNLVGGTDSWQNAGFPLEMPGARGTYQSPVPVGTRSR